MPRLSLLLATAWAGGAAQPVAGGDEKARAAAVNFPPSDQIATKADMVRLETALKIDLAQLETRLTKSLIAAVGVILVGIGIATGILLA